MTWLRLEFPIEVQPEALSILPGGDCFHDKKTTQEIDILGYRVADSDFMPFEIAAICLRTRAETNPIILRVGSVDRECFDVRVIISDRPIMPLFQLPELDRQNIA